MSEAEIESELNVTFLIILNLFFNKFNHISNFLLKLIGLMQTKDNYKLFYKNVCTL